METATGISKPSKQEEAAVQLRKAEDACVTARAELYKAEMLLRACEKCMSNNKEAKP